MLINAGFFYCIYFAYVNSSLMSKHVEVSYLFWGTQFINATM